MLLTIVSFGYVIISMIFLTPFGILAMIGYWVGLGKLMSPFIHWICIIWSRAIIAITGCEITVTGRENVPKKGGVCFVSNHGSYFDIALLMAYCGRLTGFIAKKELSYVPFLNTWIFMIGGLFIDRGNLRKSVITINKGVKKIQSGGCLVIFPEGHRSKTGELLPFHPGSLKLATLAHSVIIPVALKDSCNVFEKEGRVRKAKIKITFCEPINTAEIPVSDRKQVLSDRIYGIIKEKLET